jgi:hypothetical protein
MDQENRFGTVAQPLTNLDYAVTPTSGKKAFLDGWQKGPAGAGSRPDQEIP